MNFESEPSGYVKTAVSDLQGSWGNLRDAVVENYGFVGSGDCYFILTKL